ncbi:MAG: tetratricopeptide repeat protein [Bacteroidales bacterium]|jgi:tetratricopeptide (TPR) repeat protein|nr:tetratricopeptide repeat protein [Bacteroidales bacterium]
MAKGIYKISFGLVLLSGILSACNNRIVPAEVSGGRIKPYDTATFNYLFVEGIKQKLMGNGGEALKYLENSIIINPESDAAYFQMAQILIASGDLKNGKKYALKAYNIGKENLWYMMMLAGTYYEEKKLDSATMFYEKAAAKFPEKQTLQITLANLYSESRNFDKALKIFENLDEKYGVNMSSSTGIVKNLMWAGKWDEALERAQVLLKQYPDEILLNGLLAEIYRGKGEPENAEQVYKKLIDINPGNPQIQLALCDFLIEEKKYEDLVLLVNVVAINDKVQREDKISLFAQLIETPEMIKNSGEKMILSLMVFEAAYPDDDIISLLRTELLIKLGKTSEAVQRLEEIIIKRPENYFAWEKLLLAYLQKGDYKNLELRSEQCATRFNRSYIAKLLYATAANENKKYEVALEELRKADILAGANDEMLLQVLSVRADVYYRMKDYDKAFKTFDEALKRNKDDLTLLNNYAYYLAERNLKLREAEEMAKKVIEKEPENSTFLDTYAWVLYKRGKYKSASKIMEGIISKNNIHDAEYFEHYGYILKKRHKCSEAIKNWEKAIEYDNSKTQLKAEIENCKK